MIMWLIYLTAIELQLLTHPFPPGLALQALSHKDTWTARTTLPTRSSARNAGPSSHPKIINTSTTWNGVEALNGAQH